MSYYFFWVLLFGLVFFFWQHIGIDTGQQIDASKFGQFGDFVGGLSGSIWALAGVILFYIALKEQREDIKTNKEVLNLQVNALQQQIEEVKLQKTELELTREVFVTQSQTLKLQQFESTFFNSINLLNNIISNISYVVPDPMSKLNSSIGLENKDITHNGRASFRLFYDKLKGNYYTLKNKYVEQNNYESTSDGSEFDITDNKKEEFIKTAYKQFFNEHHSDLGHYFKTIYNTVKLIKDRKPDNPKYYTSLLRAQLSTYEHLMLFYNCQFNFGNENFKSLIIEFSMLDNLSVNELLEETHRDFYPEEAYQ